MLIAHGPSPLAWVLTLYLSGAAVGGMAFILYAAAQLARPFIPTRSVRTTPGPLPFARISAARRRLGWSALACVICSALYYVAHARASKIPDIALQSLIVMTLVAGFGIGLFLPQVLLAQMFDRMESKRARALDAGRSLLALRCEAALGVVLLALSLWGWIALGIFVSGPG